MFVSQGDSLFPISGTLKVFFGFYMYPKSYIGVCTKEYLFTNGWDIFLESEGETRNVSLLLNQASLSRLALFLLRNRYGPGSENSSTQLEIAP